MGKVKTGIKMKVNPEQSRKIQEICFENKIYWGVSGAKIKGNSQYLQIDEYIEWWKGINFIQEVSAELFIRTKGTCVESETTTEGNNEGEQMEELKLECLVEGYEGTYFEIGQVWGDRNGDKLKVKGFDFETDIYKLTMTEVDDSTPEYYYTPKGEELQGEESELDLVKLISTEATPSKESQPKTISEYLKENNAYESFVENCVEEFLNDINWYSKIKIKPKEDSIISLGNTFHWYTTKEGFYYWLDLSCNKPKNFVDDMDEIVFAEVDKRIAEQKTSTKYMVFVEGRSNPKKVHDSYDSAEKEAKRLSAKEIGCNVSVLSVVKTFKSKVIVEEVK